MKEISETYAVRRNHGSIGIHDRTRPILRLLHVGIQTDRTV
jgi:hypothetical protein